MALVFLAVEYYLMEVSNHQLDIISISDIMEKNTMIMIVAAVVVVVAIGVVAGVMLNQDDDSDSKDETTKPIDYANAVLSAINGASAKQTETFTTIEDGDKKATLCTGESIGSRVRWISIDLDKASEKFATDKADETFNKNITEDEITVMSKTLTCNHITYKTGLVDGVGYWYTYTDSYDMMEYIGYNSDGVYLHMKIKLADNDNSTTAADIEKIVKAAIGAM